MTCKARQESDQMVCHACGLVWDINDPEPPECANKQAKSYAKTRDESKTARAYREVSGK